MDDTPLFLFTVSRQKKARADNTGDGANVNQRRLFVICKYHVTPNYTLCQHGPFSRHPYSLFLAAATQHKLHPTTHAAVRFVA